jgi:hypothetical protein
VASHLLLDYTNSYGVHPFWPVRNDWYYGDAVFIVEPWLWVAAVPPLALAARRRGVRAALLLVLGAGLALAWRVGLVPWPGALALTVGALVALAVAARLAPGRARRRGLLGWLAVEGRLLDRHARGAGAARGAGRGGRDRHAAARLPAVRDGHRRRARRRRRRAALRAHHRDRGRVGRRSSPSRGCGDAGAARAAAS